MEECLGQAAPRIAEASVVARGVAMSLGGMEVGLGQDAGFYALRPCIGEILEKSACAARRSKRARPRVPGFLACGPSPPRRRKPTRFANHERGGSCKLAQTAFLR